MAEVIITTGSREYSSRETVARALTSAIHDLSQEGITEILIRHGACKTGADALVVEFVNTIERSLSSYGVTVKLDPYRANWYPNGVLDRSAGPKRNAKMVADGAKMCLAFFEPGADNNGTSNTVKLARAAGIPVRIY